MCFVPTEALSAHQFKKVVVNDKLNWRRDNLNSGIRKRNPPLFFEKTLWFDGGLYYPFWMVALMEQSSNQILMDMKNIYKFKDIIGLSTISTDIHQEIIDNIP